MLPAFGQQLRAGEVVIMGSVVPPLPVQPGDEIVFQLSPLPPISVRV
jgi:2-keto-4-pentenoate hydratase